MYWENSPFKNLVGCTILEVFVGDAEIVFVTDTGLCSYRVEGDCCSDSWISDLYNFNVLIGQKLIGIEDPEVVNTDTDDGRCRQEEDSAYGYLLCTELGKAELVFRCSSNGYYGGWIESSNRKDYSGLEEVKNNWINK